MSRKWNPFKKKSGKTDSHGTTLANEEIFFQPTARPGGQWGVPNNAISTDQDDLNAVRNNTGLKQNNNNNLSGVGSSSFSQEPSMPSFNQSWPQSEFTSNQMFGVSSNTHVQNNLSQQHQLSIRKNFASDATSAIPFKSMSLVPDASIPRTSPKVTKKLIKPGIANAAQPSFLKPTPANQDVSVHDEYTDPFDALASSQSKNRNPSAADGYVEPYEAKQMYQDVTQSSNGQSSAAISKDALYDEPWDKTNTPVNEKSSEYEEPWNNSETLPFAQRRPHQVHPRSRHPNDRHGELVLEYPAAGVQSGDSSTSSSSASAVRHKMVRVDSPRQSPMDSPHTSPKLDHRLIRPKEPDPSLANIDPRLQLYSVPGGGPKYKPVDHRLIKAEPSVGEMRGSPHGPRSGSSRGSSVTNSPAGSSRVSPNQSPGTTIVRNEALARLATDPNRRASSPLVNPHVPQYLINKAKSRSLDVRNPQILSQLQRSQIGFSKSASDEQLTYPTAFNPNLSPYKQGRPLVGVTEYEEPLESGDGSFVQGQLSSIPSSIVHSRSRSYDLNYAPPSVHIQHGKSRSYDKQEVPRSFDYEHPRDPREVPQTHLVSMKRFQQRKLELHPSEAISHKDFDPLIPLHKQSWFHGLITREEAIRRLERQIEGTYLVRNSESVPNNFSLSLRTRDDIIHMVVSRTRDGFWILGEFSAPFHSVPEMIAYYKNHHLKITDSQQISLAYPLPEEYL